MSQFSFENNVLLIDGEKNIFSYKIQQLLETNNKLFVLLDIPVKTAYCYYDYHNLYAYSKNGKKLWQVGNRELGDDSIYTLITHKENFLYATDFLGRKYSIDENNGQPGKMQVVK